MAQINIAAPTPFQAPNAVALNEAESKARYYDNNAKLEDLKLKSAQKAMENKQREEAYEFTLNVTSGVHSEEDLTMAKKLIATRYPEYVDNVEKMLPSGYDPNRIAALRNFMRTETQRLKAEELQFAPAGSAIIKNGEVVGNVPQKPSADSYEVFTTPSGDQQYVRKGDPIPPGYTKLQAAGASSSVNVYTGELGKTTRNKVEQEVIEGSQNVASFQNTSLKFKPEYLTLFGKGENIAANLADKAGISTEGQKQLISHCQNID